MALRFLDSFDDRTTTNVINRYDASTGTPSVNNTIKRTGINALSLNNASVTKNLSSIGGTGTTFIMGVAVYLSYPGVGSAEFIDLSTNISNTIRITIDGSGIIAISDNSGQFMATPTAAVPANTWTYLQIKGTISSGTVAITIIVGNTTYGPTNSHITTASIWSQFTLAGPSGYTALFDDLCVFDGSGTVNNNMPGQPKVECIRPTAAGSNTHLGLVGAASNAAAVADTSPDNDTSYVSSATPGDRDTYTTGNLSATTGYVAGIQVNMFARKDDASVRQIAASLHIGSSDYDLATVTETTAYQNLVGITEVNPANGLQMTIADVNAMEIGVKVVA